MDLAPIDDRYHRLRLISWWNQERLARARVMVIGCGALGNEVLKNLALLGVGEVLAVDFDRVERTNLTRCVLFRGHDTGRFKAEVVAERVRELNADVAVQPLVANVLTDLGLGLFAACDLVLGCLDNREARWWVNRCCWKMGIPWIDGAIQEINGVVKTFTPPHGACYECGLTETDYQLMNLRYRCGHLPDEQIKLGHVPTTPTIASIVAGMQVQEALKLLHGLPVAAGKAVVFNGVANQMYTTEYQQREACDAHETLSTPVPLQLSHQHTAADLFAAVRTPETNGHPLRLLLDRDLVVSFDCGACGQSRPVLRPAWSVDRNLARCPTCDQESPPNMIHAVDEHSPLAQHTLAELGVPAFDVVRVASASAEAAYVLNADRPAFAAALATATASA